MSDKKNFDNVFFNNIPTKIEVEKAVVSINKLQDIIEELKGLKTKIQKLEEYFD